MITANIAPEFEEFVCKAVAAGKYGSPEEVVSDGLRLLREREREALRKEIDVGIQQIESGDVVEVDDEDSHTALLEDIKSRGRRRFAAEQSPR
jgi:putative addiction module CopG family antidote